MGLLYPSNLHSLLLSSWPRGQLGPTQRAWPASPKLPRKAADRWKLLGARPWRPPGIASTSVFETSPYLPGQSTLLVPVPIGPWGSSVAGSQWSMGTGQETTQLPHSFFLGCINYLVSFIFFQIE